MTWRANQRTLVVISIVLMAFLSPSAAKVIYVDANAPGFNNGSSWDHAYNYLQDALAASISGDEIRVAQGIYKPDQSSATPYGSGDRYATFQLINGVALNGGYAGYDQPYPNKRDPNTYESTLSGDLAGNDTKVNSPRSLVTDPCRAENCIHVVTGSGTDVSTILDGFIITGGNANKLNVSTMDNGGGMYNNSGSPTMINCTFTQNMAVDGAGAYCFESNSAFENCTFSTNGVPEGSTNPCGTGLYSSYSNIRVIKSSFRNNYTENSGDGAGICNWHTSTILSECTFIDNSSTGEGGGIHNERRSTVQLRDCSFIGNSAQQNGGGISNYNNCEITLINCTFSGNSARSGGGVYTSWDCDVTLSDCIFMDNSAENGGGLYNSYRSCRMLTNCTFSANWAYIGGGIYNRDSSSPDVINCTFRNNSSRTIGGAIYNGDNSSPTLTNCIISANSAEETGGALYNYDECMPKIINCTFAANVAPEGKVIACDSSSQRYPSNLQIVNCILWDGGNEIWNNDGSIISITYSDVQGGWPGLGNIDVDPCFVFVGDFYLSEDSSCIDKGTNTPSGGLPPTDLDGNPRPLDGDGDGTAVAEMGCYEYRLAEAFIYLNPVAMTFSVPTGEPNPDGQILYLINVGGGTLHWQLAKDCPWLSASPTGGDLAPSSIKQITITTDISGLDHGVYNCFLTVSDPESLNSPESIMVRLNVSRPQPLLVPSEFETIQDAINAAVDGDVVMVANGVYKGNGNKELEPCGKVITVRSENGPNDCIIDCEHDGRGFYFRNDETKDMVVDGFTIRNGYIKYENGSGMYCRAASPTISNCILKENSTEGLAEGEGGGGGIFCGWKSCPTLMNCTFSGNSATNKGGGIRNDGGNPILTNCTFIRNSSADEGGGLHNYQSNLILNNCTFSENEAVYYGGGIFNEYSNPSVTNCTFIGNSVDWNGGGIYNIEQSEPTLTNCTFRNNSADSGGGMYNVMYCNPTVIHCIFTNNSATNNGGGMSNDCRYANPIIIDCTFSGNYADYQGGGMLNYYGPSTVSNCTFRGNEARFGGGMCNYTGRPTLTNCIFSDNDASHGGGMYNVFNSKPSIINCTFVRNSANNGNSIACDSPSPLDRSTLELTNCILWDEGSEIWNNDNSEITIRYSDVQDGWMGLGNIVTEPCFVDPCVGDYHLKSQAGRWDENSESWVKDDVTSPCIDAGNPGCPVGDEPAPNGNRKNMGAYGGTAEASKSPTYWRSIADTTNDWIVDSNDLKVLADYWLQTGECIPGDFDRSRFVDFNDFAIFAGQWRQKGPGPGITYDIGGCIPVDSPSSTTEEPNETRFTVTIVGSNIHFEDMMQANCCPEELDVQMTLEDNLITIYEIERFFTRIPCPCLCNYPITATFGPFEPGTYSLVVYQKSSFIGSTTVTIENGQ
jgi:parallel beta-helix repeat protein/predicted outer membrane repeat protein